MSSPEHGTSLPHLLYQNHLENLEEGTVAEAYWWDGATAAVSATDPDFPVNSLNDRMHWSGPWKSTAAPGGEYLIMNFTLNTGRYADSWGVTGHNFSLRSGFAAQIGKWSTGPTLSTPYDTTGWIDLNSSFQQMGLVHPRDSTFYYYDADSDTGRVNWAGAGGPWKYWRLTIGPVDAGKILEIYSLFLGNTLLFDEGFDAGVDELSLKAVSKKSVSKGGAHTSNTIQRIEQAFALKFGPYGLDETHLADYTPQKRFPTTSSTPALMEWVREYWSLDQPFLFKWNGHSHYCFPGEKAQVNSPFVAPVRRGFKMEFDILAEGYMASPVD